MVKSKKPIVIANWKMNPATEKEAVQLFKAVKNDVQKNKKVEIVIAPPAVFLSSIKREKGLILGAQDMSPEERGAFTGQISGKMLRDVGVKYVILGHSEMRHPPAGGGETNAEVSRKVSLALKLGLTPVVCVGEHVRTDNGQFFSDIREQLRESIAGIPKAGLSKLIIAYEPIWAISTTENHKDVLPEEVVEMILFIRKTMSEIAQSKKLIDTKVLYGGSVNDINIDMLKNTNADGFLVGGASLIPKKFIKIVQSLVTRNA